VRAARRLLGDSVFTQNTPREQAAHGGVGNFSIGVGGYNFDSHNSERWACKNESTCYGSMPKRYSNGYSNGTTTGYAWNEGDVEIAPGLYQIPAWIMFPKTSEVSNLIVVASPSASHIGMSTLRMEPQFMTIGHAAGVIASITIESEASSVQEIDVDMMRARLLEEGAILEVRIVK
jgi:hypothetical protein